MAAAGTPAPTPGSSASGIAPVSVTAGNDQADLQGAQNVGNAIVSKASGPVGYGAGQNPFVAAANNVDAQKAAILSALAQGGSAGRAALDRANADLAAQRQAAIKSALSGAATRGVNAGLGNALGAEQASIASTVGAPGQQYGADLSAAARDFTENSGFLQHGFDQYGQEAKAAVPVIEANTQNALQAARMNALAKLASAEQAAVARAQQTADTSAQNDALKGLELQIAQQNLARAQTTAGAAGGKTLTIITDLGAPATPATPGIPASTYGVGPNGIRNPGRPATPGTPARPPTTVTIPNTPAAIRATTGTHGYGNAIQAAVTGAQNGYSQAQVQGALIQSGYDPAIVAQVMADIKADYSGSTSTTNSPSGTTTRTSGKRAK